MTSPAVTSSATPLLGAGFLRLAATALALAAIADWLLFRHWIGIAFPIFLCALAGGILVANFGRIRPREVVCGFGVLAIGLLPTIEALGPLSLIFAVLGVSAFALIVTGRRRRTPLDKVKDFGSLLLGVPIAFIGDMITAGHHAGRVKAMRGSAGWFIAWIIPMVASAVFLALFSSANPVIDRWLASIDLSAFWKGGDPLRPLFWLLIVALIWPLLRVRLRRLPEMQVPLPEVDAGVFSPAGVFVSKPPESLFGPTAILRSLVLFNVLFAAQTIMDLAYLWGGFALPAGMSYAQYAHAGAYPLIVTALLAAAFVLAAMRPGSAARESRLIRALVYAWVAQNVLLVLSSIFRLKLYVEVYALTQWRTAAFIWMLLVTVGLILITVQIAREKSNGWLISRNIAALALTLYACSMIDFRAIIAEFNVTHSRDLTGRGVHVDINYLCQMGPQAIPAMDRLATNMTLSNPLGARELLRCRDRLAASHRGRGQEWRAWSLRGYRLTRYLQAGPAGTLSDAAPVPCQGEYAWRIAS